MAIISGERPEIGDMIKKEGIISLPELRRIFRTKGKTIQCAVNRYPEKIEDQYISNKSGGYTKYFIYPNGVQPSQINCQLKGERIYIENDKVYEGVCRFCKKYQKCYKAEGTNVL